MPMSAVLENTAKTKTQKQWLAGLVTSVMFLIVCLSWGTTWLGIKIAVEGFTYNCVIVLREQARPHLTAL